MSRKKLLEVRDLSVSFVTRETKHPVYHKAHLEIFAGDAVGLLGPSGSGKSVLTKAIFNHSFGIKASVQGSISYFDESSKETLLFPARTGSNHRIYGNEVCMVFQEPGLAFNPVFTIGNQIVEVIKKHKGLSKKEALDLIAEQMVKVGLHDADHLKKYPHELSGGQLQRFMLLMAVVNKPRLLIADEPTTSLDSITQKEVLDLLKDLHASGTALLVISHDVKVLNYLSANIYEVKNQQLAQYDVPTTRDRTIDLGLPKQETALSAQIEAVKYEKFEAVKTLSFEAKKCEILGIVGSSGCGKSTLVKAISDLIPFSGEIAPKYPKGKLQMIFQHPGQALNPSQTIGNAVIEALKISGVKNRNTRISRCDALFEQVGLDQKFKGYYPFQLSGGMKQRACIARALATSPEVLICDEAVSSLDAELKEKIAALLVSLAKELEMTLLFISHDIGLVSQLCHRILVMDKGQIVEEVSNASQLEKPTSEALKNLLNARL